MAVLLKGKRCQVWLCQFPELSLLKYSLPGGKKKTGDQKVPDKSNPTGQSENKLKGPL